MIRDQRLAFFFTIPLRQILAYCRPNSGHVPDTSPALSIICVWLEEPVTPDPCESGASSTEFTSSLYSPARPTKYYFIFYTYVSQMCNQPASQYAELITNLSHENIWSLMVAANRNMYISDLTINLLVVVCSVGNVYIICTYTRHHEVSQKLQNLVVRTSCPAHSTILITN